MEVGPLGVTLMSIVPVFGSIRSRSPVWTKEQIPPAPTMLMVGQLLLASAGTPAHSAHSAPGARAKPSERTTAPPCNFKNCSQKWCVYVLVSRVVVSQTLYTMAPCAQRAIRRR